MRFFTILSLIACFALASCVSQKVIYSNYLEDMKDSSYGKSLYITEPVIQKNDLLSIQIYSTSLRPEVDELYNLRVSSSSQQNSGQPNGYLVDQKGNLELPRLGTVHAEGLTKAQLADAIKDKLKGQLNDPTVIIRFQNFRIIVIGEVGSPGVKTVPVENLTILEALAMAGDITENGKKQEVRILRENHGQRQFGVVDVTNSKLFESSYYQLQQNDVVMVERSKYSIHKAEQARVQTQLTLAVGLVSAAAIILNLFKR